VPISIASGGPWPRSYQAIVVPATGVVSTSASKPRAEPSPHPAIATATIRQIAGSARVDIRL
jgi:hypothetical protein